MNRKVKLLPLLMALTLVFSLAACSGGSSGGAPSAQQPASQAEAPAAPAADTPTEAPAEGGRSLVIAKLYAEEAEVVLEEKYIEAPIHAAFPNDEISFQVFTDRQSLQVQVAGGGGPDILDLDGPTDAVEYYKAGRIVSLDKYAEQYGWKDQFYDWAWGVSLYKDELISLPNSFEGMLMFYNMDLFNEHGWAIPTNEAELVDIMNKAQEANLIPIAFGNSNYPGAVDWLYSTFLSGYAGPPALKEALEGKRQWSDPLISGSIKQMVDWWQLGYIGDKASQAVSYDDARAMFATGRAPMMISGTWAMTSLMSTYADCNWKVTLMPELRAGVGDILPLATGGCFAINANSKVQDFAAEVLNYRFTDVDSHMAGVREAGFQPFPLQAITGESFKGLDPRVTDTYDVLMDAQAEGAVGYCAWAFFPSAARMYMNDNTDALFLGSLTIDEYMNEVQGFVDAALADGTAPAIP